MKNENKKNEENKENKSILGHRGKKLLKFLKMRSVSGRIPEEEFHEWETYKELCVRSGLKVSDEGLLDMIVTNNKICKILYPMASDMGYSAVNFKNLIVDLSLDVVSTIYKDKWKKDSEKIRKEIMQGFEESLNIKLSNN